MSLDMLRDEEASHPFVVKRLRDQYNNIMENLQKEIPKLVTDPLERLPPEISLRCLSNSLPEWNYASHLLDLTMVSSRWKEFVISAPVLWARIDVRSSQNDSLATLAIFLELSRATQIDLSIWNDLGDELDGIASLLFPHRRRIRTVNVKQEKTITRELHFSIASKIMQSLRHLPALTTINFGRTLYLEEEEWKEISSYSDGWIFNNLQVSPLSEMPMESDMLASLGDITTMDTLSELGPKFAAMQNLTKIHLRVPPEREVTVLMVGVPPRLSSLTCHDDFSESLFLLIDSVTDTLRELSLSITSSQWRQLARCLVKATKLKELDIYVKRAINENTNIKRVIPLNTVRSLEVLSLQGNWWAGSTLFPQPKEVTFDEVMDDCTILYPGVRSFTLYFDLNSDDRSLRAFLENLRSLEYLRLRGRTPNWTVQVIPYKLPTLRRLDTVSTLLPYISAPNLEWFRVSAGEGLEATRFRSILGAHIWIDSGEFCDFEPLLHHGSYPELAHLTLELPAVRSMWFMPRLHSLRSVVIKSEERLDQNATTFCLSILYFPDSCPLLEEVELSGFVEWDILVLMLERRNFSTAPVKRIRTLKLPLRPPHLANVISSLLDGKFTERPSNTDLSTEGIREVLCSTKVYAFLPPLQTTLNDVTA